MADTTMRVALYEPFGAGGIYHYAFELADALARAGVQVTLFTRPDHEFGELARPFEIRGQVQHSQLKTWLGRLVARRPRRAAPAAVAATADRPVAGTGPRRRRPDVRQIILWGELLAACLWRRVRVMHVQWLTDPDREYYLLKALQVVGIRVVYTAHNLLPHESDSAHDRAACQRIYGLVDRIIVHAESNRDEMLAEFAVDPAKIAVVPHGAYELFYRGVTLTRQEARAALGLPGDRKIVLFFGSIRRYKGLEYLVEAFRKARRNVDGLLLLVVGKVHTPDAVDFAAYSALVAGLKPEDDVVHRSCYVPVEQVPSYFIASDVVALPYAKTYQSGVLALAYAAGRAVVASDTGGLSEVVEFAKSGFVVPPCDADRLAEAIVDVASDPDVMEAMGRHAKHLADTKYSWRNIAARTLDLYAVTIAADGEGAAR